MPTNASHNHSRQDLSPLSRVIHAPAKINWVLALGDVRADGYQELTSLMQKISLAETLTIIFQPDAADITFTCNWPELAEMPEENLVVRAYRLFWQETGMSPFGMNVHLEKQIPHPAGLGGGSSDAAAMLRGLRDLCQEVYDVAISEETLLLMASRLGSDVPFFVSDASLSLATGRGDIIQPLNFTLPEISLLVVKPKRLGISTAAAYHAFRQSGISPKPVVPDTLLQTLQNSQMPCEWLPLLRNDFESVLFTQYPLLAEMAQGFQSLGAERSLLCGSGPAMVGCFLQTLPNPDRILGVFPEDSFWVYPLASF